VRFRRTSWMTSNGSRCRRRTSLSACQPKARHLYVDGGKTIQGFLRAGLIDELTITRVPILIGTGVPLFGSLDHDVRLTHIATRQFENGFVQSKYRVAETA
jgi:dihydrofolate reductase